MSRTIKTYCRRETLAFVILGVMAIAIAGAFLSNRPASAAGTPQASITLSNSDAQYCYTHNNVWTLDKSVTGNTIANGAGTVTWTVTATKDSSAAPTFTVQGGLTVTNTGSAPATIGNIVVNLQKPNSPKRGSNAPYVSVAADVADATNGDAAASAKIVAAGSQENPTTNALWGTNNYTVSGAQGMFTVTAGSGTLGFTDASDNSVFSLVPQPVIPVGQSITLLYHASFNTSVLVAGTSYRVEALVSFGNSGARGGSGATATNIDINGNGVIDSDEANVRTVPSRVILPALPSAPSECNGSVTVTDSSATTSGTVTPSNPVGFDQFPATVSSTSVWNVSVDVDSGTAGGGVCNRADLNGAGCGGTLNVIIGYGPIDPNTGQPTPIYATYVCSPPANAHDEACVDVAPPSGGSGCDTRFCPNDYCTYTQGGYQGGGVPAAKLVANWATVAPVTIGIDDGAGPKHSAKWNNTALGLSKFQTWLAGGGPSGPLTGDTVDATSTSGGTLAKQTATLDVNIKLGGGFGSLIYHNAGDSLDGKTVSQILTAANAALGGNGLPVGYSSFGDLNTLITNLNEAFDNCTPSSWVQTHLDRS